MGDTGSSVSIGGTTLSSDTVANPCGLIAKYQFTGKTAWTIL